MNNTTTVSCSVTNDMNETPTGTFNVTVIDSIGPFMNNTGNIVVEGKMTRGAVVVFAAPNSTDIVDVSIEASCEPHSGSFFALGSTVVTCIAYDDSKHNATGVFNVTVVDTTPPILYVPEEELNYEASDVNGTNVFFSVNATFRLGSINR